jgi:hypothetical protein
MMRIHRGRGENRELMFLCIAFAILTGCGNNNQQVQTKGIKINELAATQANSKGPQKENLQMQILHTTNINVVTYELPADKIPALDDIWKNLNANALRYNDANGFSANELRAGAGTIRDFPKIMSALTNSKAKKLYTTSLMIQTNQPEIVDMARLTRKTMISYIGRQGAVQNNEMGPGNLAMQVMARQILPDLQTGSANTSSASIQITPIIYYSTEGLSPQMVTQIRANDVRIYSAGFGMNIKPGEFIVLAPARITVDEKTAADRFFIKHEPDTTIRILLFICSSIT